MQARRVQGQATIGGRGGPQPQGLAGVVGVDVPATLQKRAHRLEAEGALGRGPRRGALVKLGGDEVEGRDATGAT